MDLHLDDGCYVRAPAADCYSALTDLAAWPEWWPGTRVVLRPGEDHDLVTVGRGPGRLVLQVRGHGWRNDVGFHLVVDGTVTGAVEYWLEPGWDGTVVHHLATLRGRSRHLRRYRRWAWAGLFGVKDRVQAAVLAEDAA